MPVCSAPVCPASVRQLASDRAKDRKCAFLGDFANQAAGPDGGGQSSLRAGQPPCLLFRLAPFQKQAPLFVLVLLFPTPCLQRCLWILLVCFCTKPTTAVLALGALPAPVLSALLLGVRMTPRPELDRQVGRECLPTSDFTL